MLVLLSCAVSLVYADAPVMVDIVQPTQNAVNQPFSLDATQWGYQFSDKISQVVTFTLTVDQSSAGSVYLQCWHGPNPVETQMVRPGQTSIPCVTDDAIRIVTEDDRNLPATGFYSFTIGS